MTSIEQRPTGCRSSLAPASHGALMDLLAHEATVHACHPVNMVAAADAQARLLTPLARAFPRGEDRADVSIEGEWQGQRWTASTGHLAGIFADDLWGIPATKMAAWLRYGRVERWAGDRIAELYLILDLPGLMIQAGVWPLARSLGPVVVPPGPATRDGVSPGGDGGESLALVEAMIAGLMRYDGRDLASMRMVDFWHRDFWWHGPAPIGSFCGHADYERGHQQPFLAAFPDRRGGNHVCRIAEGAYVASAGWPSIRATHSGGDWLGLAPTGQPVTMRVMDFWRRDGRLLAENWVFIDIPELLLQLGVDIFARMRALSGVALRP